MEKNLMDEGMMALLLEDEAWKDLSRDLAWSEPLLDKYKDKVDWEEVSSNGNVFWTVSMLEKFRRRIDWKQLSRTGQGSLLTPEVVDRFRDSWDWTELSGNSDLPVETVEKMADWINWKELLNTSHYRDDSFFSRAFLDKFRDHITPSILRGTRLWSALVEEKRKEMERTILG